MKRDSYLSFLVYFSDSDLNSILVWVLLTACVVWTGCVVGFVSDCRMRIWLGFVDAVFDLILVTVTILVSWGYVCKIVLCGCCEFSMCIADHRYCACSWIFWPIGLNLSFVPVSWFYCYLVVGFDAGFGLNESVNWFLMYYVNNGFGDCGFWLCLQVFLNFRPPFSFSAVCFYNTRFWLGFVMKSRDLCQELCG